MANVARQALQAMSKCGKSIHARLKSHEECGWKDTSSPSGKAAKAAGKGMSKMEAVRQSLAQLGNDAKPLEIKGHIKKQFNITMEPTVISSYKTSIFSKAKKNGRRNTHGSAPVKLGRPSAADSIRIDDILAVKDLANRMGVERLQQLIKVIAK